MKEGEPVLGGPQVTPGSTPVSNVGPQPISPATPQYPSSDFSSLQPKIQPAMPNGAEGVHPSAPASPRPSTGDMSSVGTSSIRDESVMYGGSIPANKVGNIDGETGLVNSGVQMAGGGETQAISGTQATNNMAPAGGGVQPVNNTMGYTGGNFEQYEGDIVLNPTAGAKKPKKWLVILLVVLGVFALVGVGVAVVPRIIAGPVQDVKIEDYNNLRELEDALGNTTNFIEFGLDNDLSFYTVFLSSYVKENNQTLYDALYDADSWSYTADEVSDIINKTPEQLTQLEDIINNMSKVNYPSEINEKVKEIQEALPNYSAVINALFSKLPQLISANLTDDPWTNLKEVMDNFDVTSEIEYSTTEFREMATKWDGCIAENDTMICELILSQDISDILDNTVAVRWLFESFVSEDDTAMLQSTNENISQLVELMEERLEEQMDKQIEEEDEEEDDNE